MRKKLLLSAVGALCVCGIAANASAVPVSVQFTEWYEWGRTYDYTGTPGTPGTPGVFKATNENPYYYVTNPSISSTQDLPENVYTTADGTEDSFGIALVTSIFETGNSTNKFYNDATNGTQQLTMFYTNGDDVKAKFLDLDTARLYSKGFLINIYLDANNDYNPNVGYVGRGSDWDGGVPNDPNSYQGATEGILALSLKGHARYLDWSGTEQNDRESYELDALGNLETGSVSGEIYLDVVGGIWKDFYDTNSWNMSNLRGYGFADFRLKTAMLPNDTGSDWALEGTVTTQGNVVPEPATMLLFGTGLAGLAGMNRRRRKTQE